MPRFDEIELEPMPFGAASTPTAETPPAPPTARAPIFRRMMALLIDISLFGALAVTLSPLLPSPPTRLALGALGGFVVVISFYYFVGSWMLWGRTIGGAIFDVRIAGKDAPHVPLRSAVVRWTALYLSLATAGLGFLLALLPSRRSLADRMSGTQALRVD
jgi:uncharacterized RDD family membrane protein YckC